MKLRLQCNSLRLRLKRHEVQQLAGSGRVEERVCFGGGDHVLHYVLEASYGVSQIQARFNGHGILVEVPLSTVAHWAACDDVGITATQPSGDSDELQILIEKDFACLNGTDEQNMDTFPHPLTGTKC
jgi:hypothetical protein